MDRETQTTFKLIGNNSVPSRVVSINSEEGYEVIAIGGSERQGTQLTDKNQYDKAFVITCPVENIETALLIDTGASASFILHNFLQEIIKANPQVRMEPNCLTLKLADSHSISTRGTVELHVRIQTREVLVQLHVVDDLVNPIILGCNFLRHERIILRFDNNLTDISNLNLIQEIEEKQNI